MVAACLARQALRLNPNDPAPHIGVATCLPCQAGRRSRGVSWRARELDPLGISGTNIGYLVFSARHYDEAIQDIGGAIALRPDDAYAHWFLGFALLASSAPRCNPASREGCFALRTADQALSPSSLGPMPTPGAAATRSSASQN